MPILRKGFFQAVQMNPFEIEILYHNESTKMLRSINMTYSFDALDRIPMFIHHFDAVHPFVNDGKEYTEIYLSTGTVLCTLTYDEFIETYKAFNP
jgi:hypothetical protein